MTEPNGTEGTPKKWHTAFLDALAQHGNVSRAARTARISRVHLYRERREDPTFAQAWGDALAIGLDSLEDVANVRARKGSDTLIIFLLKAHRPEKYRDIQHLEHSGPEGGPIPVVIDRRAALAAIAPGSISDSDALGTD